ncbi:hypothetical protein ADUPG1_000609, partial [Aduncisulcus paluster]
MDSGALPFYLPSLIHVSRVGDHPRHPRKRMRNINWIPGLQALRRLSLKLIKTSTCYEIHGFGWKANYLDISSKLQTLKTKMVTSSWMAHPGAGRAALYYKGRTVCTRLLHAFPQSVRIRMHMLTKRGLPGMCPLCRSQNTQTHLLGGCHEMMGLYRQRHHDIRDNITKLIKEAKPGWEVEQEIIREEGDLRDDIQITISERRYWLDVTVTYEDASLSSFEKRLNEKAEKYGENGSAVVVGHSGIIMKESLNFLKEIGLTSRHLDKVEFVVGAI